jgi:hypothetical protein
MQHLHLAHGAVTGMDLQGTVPWIDAGFCLAIRASFPEIQNIGLDCLQEKGFTWIGKDVAFLTGQLREPPEEIAALRSHRGQQAVARFEVKVCRGQGFHPGGFSDFFDGPSHFPVGPDVRPEFPAGIQGKEVEIQSPGQLIENFKMEARKPGDSEDGNAFRQGMRCRQGAPDLLEQRPPEEGRMTTSIILPDFPPEVGLPGFLAGPVLPRLPVQHHVRAENQVLIKKVSQAAGELIAFEPRGVILQITPEACKFRIGEEGGQLSHDPPRRDLRIVSRRLPVLRQQGSEQLIQKGVGKRKADIGADALLAGQFHGKPAFHSLALDDDNLRRQGGGQRAPDAFSQGAGEKFQPVSDITFQACHHSFHFQSLCIKIFNNSNGLSTMKSGLAAASRSRLCHPQVTATVLTPAILASRISPVVSPI